LNGRSPWPFLKLLPAASDDKREDGGRSEEGNQHGGGSKKSTCPLSDGNDHHHIGTRGHLAHAVQVDQLLKGEPLMNVDGQHLHLGKRGHAATDGEQGEVGEHADKRRNLVHRTTLSFCSLRGRWKRIARMPTPISVRGTTRCNRFTAITVSAMKTKSNFPSSDFLLSPTTVDRIRPTAAAATPFSAAVTQTWSPWMR